MPLSVRLTYCSYLANRLSEEDLKDYKMLVATLSRRFASAAGEADVHLQIGQRCQQATETLDGFVDALVDLTNRAYPGGRNCAVQRYVLA